MPKPEIDGKEREYVRGDVVQITNERHYYFPALVVVSKPRLKGIMGYILLVTNDGVYPVHLKLKNSDVEHVGTAAIVQGKSE